MSFCAQASTSELYEELKDEKELSDIAREDAVSVCVCVGMYVCVCAYVCVVCLFMSVC